MTESAKTLVYVTVAAVLALGALSARGLSGGSRPEEFDDQGQEFYPEFTQISKATSLEVWEFDEARGGQVPFKVELKDGVWRIPSKHGYPADAKDQLAKTAASLIGLTRTVLRATQERDHARFGVIDPKAPPTQPVEGRGRRVTLRDAEGQVLVDLIVGAKAGEGDDEDDQPKVEGQSGLSYVRRADEKRVYGTKLDLDLSTEFSDWIETDLLQLDIATITSITNDAYKVDEEFLETHGAIKIIPGEKTQVGKNDEDAWVVEGMKPDEQASTAAIDSLTDTLKELTIADVLPREQARLDQAGFFRTQQGQVYSNEGELRIDLADGVTYVLRFGEAVPSPEDEEGLRRFMVVNAQPNQKLIGDDETKKQKALERVKELNDRFGDWYYVIKAQSFDGLRPKRAVLTEPKPAEEKHSEDDGHGHGAEEEEHGPPPPPGAEKDGESSEAPAEEKTDEELGQGRIREARELTTEVSKAWSEYQQQSASDPAKVDLLVAKMERVAALAKEAKELLADPKSADSILEGSEETLAALEAEQERLAKASGEATPAEEPEATTPEEPQATAPEEPKATTPEEPKATAPAPIDPELQKALLDPSLATEKAPEAFKVRFQTSKGDFVISVTRAWAPKGADRFYNLARIGFFDGVRFFRVLKSPRPFVAQFGINGDPAVSAKWREATFPDDPVKQTNAPGTVTFATAGPNTRTTQLFINYGDNKSLDGMGFSPFGKVTEGMDVVQALHGGYGEGAPQGKGPRQDLLQTQGNAYLKKSFPKLDFVKTARIIE